MLQYDNLFNRIICQGCHVCVVGVVKLNVQAAFGLGNTRLA